MIDQELRGTLPKLKEMEMTRVPTEFIATPELLSSRKASPTGA